MQLAIGRTPWAEGGDRQVLGSSWQRCTVHFLRDLRGHCRKDQHDALGALIRQLFTAADGAEARRRLPDAISQLEPAAEDRPAARASALVGGLER